ncbi:fasciclin-like arabinogalactan protein 15 [Elaeis guineensis]|uniref:Fasciclin-like arabinogalactan protein 16 n=1 Tax=Elaeis guineensis var. tenera TaxID=51953 RepID=A0A6I9R545_ELAGV|nr:fasciclin-like arabinogalactan protein 16 [Elaeis guineensis]XP_029119576.1 fasciclin-like arabinogalactan protein 16 [Elaeis guineensis]
MVATTHRSLLQPPVRPNVPTFRHLSFIDSAQPTCPVTRWYPLPSPTTSLSLISPSVLVFFPPWCNGPCAFKTGQDSPSESKRALSKASSSFSAPAAAMDSGHFPLLLALLLTILAGISSALPENAPTLPSQINSNSVLVALLDSHYTELAELVEKALLLRALEDAVGRHNLTIFAPRNDALDPEFKHFLLEPGNLKSLQTLILYHVIPSRVVASESWAAEPVDQRTLSGDRLRLSGDGTAVKRVGTTVVIHPDAVVRPDGVIHGIERMLVPRSVQEEYLNRRRRLSSVAAVLPTGAPEADPRTTGHRLFPSRPVSPSDGPTTSPDPAVAAPSSAPAPAPGSAFQVFDGESEVRDFIQSLIRYGGYNELADVLANLTSLASEMGRLVSEGYVLTVLAPNDEAMGKLTAEQLSEAGAPERMVYYHLIPEYQTEESMYNAVRRFGKVRYDTLRVPHKVVAREADGSVKFGQGEASAYLFDPDIYTDGRISVQGIDSVLFPPEEDTVSPAPAPTATVGVAKPRRGMLLEVACQMVGAFGQRSRFTTCQ